MKPEQENFEALRRLLVLKRYEQPPPGYFNDLSQHIVARIAAGDKGQEETTLDRIFGEAPWMRRIWGLLEGKPILVGAFGAAVCGLMLAGMVYSENATVASAPVLFPVADSSTPAPAAQLQQASMTPLITANGLDLSNTGGVTAAQSQSSLFQQFDQSKPWVVVPANYNVPGGN
jgi:hypothetical protein